MAVDSIPGTHRRECPALQKDFASARGQPQRVPARTYSHYPRSGRNRGLEAARGRQGEDRAEAKRRVRPSVGWLIAWRRATGQRVAGVENDRYDSSNSEKAVLANGEPGEHQRTSRDNSDTPLKPKQGLNGPPPNRRSTSALRRLNGPLFWRQRNTRT